MASNPQFSFAKRCLFLCGIAGVVLIWLVVYLVDIQLSGPKLSAGMSEGGVIKSETIHPRRGLIMDANEEILTNNTQNNILVADGYHLTDIKAITYPLAYSVAVHKEHWLTLETEKAKDKYLAIVRGKLLKKATAETDEGQEYNLAKILIEEQKKENTNALQLMQERNEKLYNPEKVDEYIREHVRYAAKVIAPHLNLDKNLPKEQAIEKKIQEIIHAIEGDRGIATKGRFVIEANLSEEQTEIIKDAISKAHVRGFNFESGSKRTYPVPECLTHVIGYIGMTDTSGPRPVALAGLEKQLDDQLMGHPGVREYRHDRKGRIIPSADARFKDAVDGRNIRLTVNMEYQTIIEEELKDAISYYTDSTHKPSGCIIVVEPKTGNILAMASRPHYNLNTLEGLKDGASNYAVQALYVPGSTLKVVAVTAAVDSGKTTFTSQYPTNDHPIPGSRPVTDRPYGPYGTLSVNDILKKSSNAGTFRVAKKVGWAGYKPYLERFGFTTPTGICLPGGPRNQCLAGNNFVNVSRICFVYSVMVSPLQVAMAYAAIANNGVRMKPRLIDGYYLDDHNFRKIEPVEVCRVMKESTARGLRNALWHVTDVQGGTGKRARVEGYNVGGKTGTAHKVDKGAYVANRYTVSFVGMMPVEDPAFVCLVVINDPTNKHHRVGGGTVCAPIFQKVATRLAAAMNLPKLEPEPKGNNKNSGGKNAKKPS